MAEISPFKEVYSMAVTKKHGRPCGFGRAWYGKSRFAEYDPRYGIYMRRHKKGRVIYIRMKHYTIPYSNSEQQETNRTKFAQGVLNWQGLTTEQKQFYNKLKYPTGMSGYNRYLRLYMKDKIL